MDGFDTTGRVSVVIVFFALKSGVSKVFIDFPEEALGVSISFCASVVNKRQWLYQTSKQLHLYFC
jgi:hypothetical protein